ncbi:MAG: zinc ribbon-containing protein, partial [Plesiomonas sp.]
MSQWTKYYRAFIDRFTQDLQAGEHELNKAVETTESYLNATSDLTRDELALINAYIERDLAEFAQSYAESKEAFKEGV